MLNGIRVKFKVKEGKKGAFVKVVVREAEINRRTFEYVAKAVFKFLVQPRQQSKRVVLYALPQCQSLETYLKNPVTRYDFYCIALQILLMFRMVQKKQELNVKDLVLDVRYMFISPPTKDIHALYLPLQAQTYVPNLSDFLQSISQHMLVEDTEAFVPAFVHLVKSKDLNQADALDFVIRYVVDKEPKLGIMLEDKELNDSGFLAKNREEKKKHEWEKNATKNPNFMEEINTTLFENQNAGQGGVTFFSPPTELMAPPASQGGAVLEETTLIGQAPCYARLLRKSTNEIIVLNKTEFLLGKEAGKVDYVVQGNEAVSRAHAKFCVKHGKLFLQDLNSKNRTFVNNVPLESFQEVELFDQSVFWLANEEFVLQK